MILKDQVAIITGSNSGIGAGIAVAMARAGAVVIINYPAQKSLPAATDMRDFIRKEGGRAEIFQADVSSEEQVIAMFRFAITTFGTVDILVNNAGIQSDAPFTDMALAQWQRVLDVNLTGQFL